VCAVSCGGGLTNCSGVCRDLANDRLNCGSCGRTCGAGEVCTGGACTVSCGGGLTNCSGVCRDLANDRLNCGSCGATCAAGQICSGSSCALSCPAGTVACGGTCESASSMACTAPTDLGSIAAGSSTGSPIRTLPAAGQEDWYLVRFPPNYDFQLHGTGSPAMSFSVNDGSVFRMDVLTSCGSTGAGCYANGVTGAETAWGFRDTCGSGSCASRPQAWPSTVYVRVWRVTGGVDCTSRYRLSVSR
jgi:hypothetical protein